MIEKGNRSGVGAHMGRIIILLPRGSYAPEDAANLAAWLFVMSRVPRAEFDAVVDAIQAS